MAPISPKTAAPPAFSSACESACFSFLLEERVAEEDGAFEGSCAVGWVLENPVELFSGAGTPLRSSPARGGSRWGEVVGTCIWLRCATKECSPMLASEEDVPGFGDGAPFVVCGSEGRMVTKRFTSFPVLFVFPSLLLLAFLAGFCTQIYGVARGKGVVLILRGVGYGLP